MSAETKIEWCDASLSPWEGCTKVSEGCAHCYAEARDRRHLHEPATHWGPGAPRWRVKTFEANARALDRRAAREGRRLRVFPSLCDPFDAEVPATWLSEFFAVVRETPHLDWLLLTKRPEMWAPRTQAAFRACAGDMATAALLSEWLTTPQRAPVNVWLGASVETQRRADERLPELCRIPARVRFVSAEPLLEPVDLLPHIRYRAEAHRIHWAIIGGESGPKARMCAVDWVRHLACQCVESGVPVFIKQLGAAAVRYVRADEGGILLANGERVDPLELRDAKGGNPEEWPVGLRVREVPA